MALCLALSPPLVFSSLSPSVIPCVFLLRFHVGLFPALSHQSDRKLLFLCTSCCLLFCGSDSPTLHTLHTRHTLPPDTGRPHRSRPSVLSAGACPSQGQRQRSTVVCKRSGLWLPQTSRKEPRLERGRREQREAAAAAGSPGDKDGAGRAADTAWPWIERRGGCVGATARKVSCVAFAESLSKCSLVTGKSGLKKAPNQNQKL